MKIKKKSLISKEFYSIKEIVELVNSGLKLGNKKNLSNLLEEIQPFINIKGSVNYKYNNMILFYEYNRTKKTASDVCLYYMNEGEIVVSSCYYLLSKQIYNCCNIELKNFDENFRFQALL